MSSLKQFLNLCGDVCYRLCRLKAGYHLSALVGEEFCEVPLDVRAVLVVGVGLGEHLVEDRVDGVALIPACEAFLFLQELEQGIGVRAVYLNFLETGKLGAVGKLAEAVD